LLFKLTLQQLNVDGLIVDDEDFGLTFSAQNLLQLWGAIRAGGRISKRKESIDSSFFVS
jgi:hypothetical protein